MTRLIPILVLLCGCFGGASIQSSADGGLYDGELSVAYFEIGERDGSDGGQGSGDCNDCVDAGIRDGDGSGGVGADSGSNGRGNNVSACPSLRDCFGTRPAPIGDGDGDGDIDPIGDGDGDNSAGDGDGDTDAGMTNECVVAPCLPGNALPLTDCDGCNLFCCQR